MSDEPRRRGLGRGLSALLGEDQSAAAPATPQAGGKTVAIELLHPGRFQPRRVFDEEALAALAESIAAQGVLQPLLVRRHPDLPDNFEILAGERRWRAAQRAKLHEVPVLLRDLTDREALEVAIVENVQRQDLSVIEEAQGYKRLIDEFGHTQDALGKALGKSRVHITNTMRLLNLPPEVQAMLEHGRLTAGHARALLGARDPHAAALEVVRYGMNVRQTEAMCKRTPEAEKADAAPRKSADTLALEHDLSLTLGLKVTLSEESRETGVLSIRYKSLDQLDEVLGRLKAASRGR